MDQSLISIVVPYLNHSAFIASCCEKLMEQTHTNTEIILVNNGSTDGSDVIAATMAENFPDKIKLINEQRKGIPFARNAGLQNAKGKYVSFLDVDDHFTNNKLELLHSLLEKHPNAAMAYGKTKRIYVADGKEVIQDTGVAVSGINQPPTLALDWTRSFYRLPQTGATLIRTSVARNVGGFPTNLLLGNDDVGFHIKISLNYPVIFHPFIAVNYFRHPQSEGSRLNDNVRVHFRYLDAHIKSTNIMGYSYYENTNDIRLWGLAQRGIFLNTLVCYFKSKPQPVPGNLKIMLFVYYRLMLNLFTVLPYTPALFIYKITRRIVSLNNSDKYPL